jgi:branched-chain amino acid transport system permease protein
VIGQLINGLTAGGGYALAAVGLTYTLGIARVMNFAYGVIFVLGAVIANSLIGGKTQVLYGLAVVLVVVFAIGFGLVFARVAVLPVINAGETAVMIMTLGVGVMLTNAALWKFGGQVTVGESSLSKHVYLVQGAVITQQDILTFATALFVTVGLVAFMRYTLPGTRIRAVAQNAVVARVTGMSTSSTYTIAIVIGVVLAALTGALFAPGNVVSVFAGDSILLKAFTIAALAGMGQIVGAFVVGIGFGVAESLLTAYVTSNYTAAVLYLILVVTLLFFPRGLLRGE